jgi:hypothetical protein
VVKASDYPGRLAPDFQALEEDGHLRPMFSADVSTFAGFRIYGAKLPLRVVILEVVPAAAAGSEASRQLTVNSQE